MISDEQVQNIVDDFDMYQPVQGTWIRKERGQLIIGATTRSAIALFLVPFMFIVTICSIKALIMSEEFSFIAIVFGIISVVCLTLFWMYALMTVFGKVEIQLDRHGGTIFSGIGLLGTHRSFKWKDVATVYENEISHKRRGNKNTEIVLDGNIRMSVGLKLSDSRRNYLFQSLKNILAMAKSNKRFV